MLQKDPSTTVDFTIDWASQLGADTISTSSWTVASGITKEADTKDSRSATIWVSGGTDGQFYELTNTIVTAGGRTLEHTLYVEVAEQAETFTGSAVTQADVIRLAHRKLGIVSAEQSVSADQDDYAKDILQGIWGEHSGSMNFSIMSPSLRYYAALADLLASEIAPHYQVAGPDRTRALMRLRAILLPNDRTDPADTDGDGIVSAAERAAADRAVYY